MALTRLELGDMYYTKGGVLERKFLGCVLYMSSSIKGGGLPDATQAQLDWANMLVGADSSTHMTEARKAMEWGLANNSSLQDQGESLADGDLDWITKEYAKTYA